MANAAQRTRTWANPTRIGSLAALAILAIALGPMLPHLGDGWDGAHLRAPRWELWGRLTPATQLHIVGALVALAIGIVILARPKGRGLHKTLGWAWVVAMGVTAVSSLLITGLNGNSYSLIHLLSGWTIIALPMGVAAIRRRNLKAHSRAMTGLFVGGLIVAGLLTFLPGRFMFEMFLG